MAEFGGRAVERKLTLPVTSDSAMLGVKPMFSGRSLADGANADFDVIMLSPDGKALAKNGVRYDLLKVESSYQWYRRERPMGVRTGQTNGRFGERHGGYCR